MNFKSITLKDATNFAEIFHSIESIRTWAEREAQVWNYFYNLMLKSFENLSSKDLLCDEVLTKQINPFKNLLLSCTNEKDLRNYVPIFNESNVLFSLSSKGIKILKLAEDDLISAAFLLCIWKPDILYHDRFFRTSKHLGSVEYKKYYEAFFKAHIEARLFEVGVEGTEKVEREGFLFIKNEANTLVEDIGLQASQYHEKIEKFDRESTSKIQHFDKIISEKITAAEQAFKEHTENITRIEKFYRETLSIQEPVKFWFRKAVSHREAAYFWLHIFIFLVIFIVPNSLSITESILNHMLVKVPDIQHSPFALLFIISFPFFLVIWVLRIISRNMFTNFNNMHEAQTRAVMTQTFLALMHENKAKDDERILILSALFRPMNAQADDGAPPSWLGFIEKINTKP